MKTRPTLLRALGLGILTSAMLIAPAGYGKTLTWTGGGFNASRSTPANWGGVGVRARGDSLVFPSSALQFISSNNLPLIRLDRITFALGANRCSIRGNTLVLPNGLNLLYLGGTNRFYPNISLGVSQNWDFMSGGGKVAFYAYGDIGRPS